MDSSVLYQTVGQRAGLFVCVCVCENACVGWEGWLQVEKGSFNVDPINRSRVNTSPSATIYIVTVHIPQKDTRGFLADISSNRYERV